MRAALLKFLRTAALMLIAFGIFAVTYKDHGENWFSLWVGILLILSVFLLFDFRNIVKLLFSINTPEGEFKILAHTGAIFLGTFFYFATASSKDAASKISPWAAAILGLLTVYLFYFLWWLVFERPFSGSSKKHKPPKKRKHPIP
ncbi:hypothetical protein [Collimonas fungivorans]|uniref:hypothetical protein n=1 Tax=Collimonas fungivorans TaxID=158899 RepID=UPI0011D23A39|nr:hypothetical protein [Collimonas fungivorans]